MSEMANCLIGKGEKVQGKVVGKIGRETFRVGNCIKQRKSCGKNHFGLANVRQRITFAIVPPGWRNW